MTRPFPSHAYRILTYLGTQTKAVPLSLVAENLSLDQSQVMAVCTTSSAEGWVAIHEVEGFEVSLEETGHALLSEGKPLPERAIASVLRDANKALSMQDIGQFLGSSAQDVGKALRFLLAKGYAVKEGKDLRFSDTADLTLQTPDERLLARVLAAGGSLLLSAEESREKATADLLKDLKSRDLAKSKSRTLRSVELTEAGHQLLRSGITEIRQVNQITEAMLLSGEWKNVSFRPYDVTLDIAPIHTGKAHPLRRVLEETRHAFLRMGFTEIRGPYVESAFWDFDALFQPQDHPAREMQDTFYCQRPETFELPDPALVETIRRTHEEGGDTGSTGWRYRWSSDKARQVVLRTHTTAATVASCFRAPQPPQKIFCVGRVFRRETIDYKHLPEFHQVDGVILDEDASLASLLGTLAEFYRQMGFEDVKFRPDFFPYTEPSVGVFVRMPGRKDWFELGGAGVFRPEVTHPVGVRVPVLAWGLGLERLAMLRYQIQDIRQLYLSQIDWLKEIALCR